MKRFLSIASCIILLALVGQSSMAQSLKFGHISSEELIQALPEFDTATVQLTDIG